MTTTTPTDIEALANKLERLHDDLNCMVDDGYHFKTSDEKAIEISKAMAGCFEAATTLRAIAADRDRLSARVAELEKRLAKAQRVVAPFAAYADEPDLVPTISEYIAARDWITAQDKTDADHG